MKNYFVKNSWQIISLISWILSVIILFFYTGSSGRTLSGKITYDDGLTNYTSIINNYGDFFKFDTYFEANNHLTQTSQCEGNYIIINGKIELETDEMDGICLDVYNINKVEDRCYLVTHKTIKSRNQSFFFCEKK